MVVGVQAEIRTGSIVNMGQKLWGLSQIAELMNCFSTKLEIRS